MVFSSLNNSEISRELFTVEKKRWDDKFLWAADMQYDDLYKIGYSNYKTVE